jgi:uncharacterized protein (DUF2384 family)
MSDEPSDPLATSLAAPKRKHFRNKHMTPRVSPEGVERQSRVTLLAWNLLGADSAIAFLNTYNDGLAGRPLDLAVASDAGCEAVEHAIAARASGE